MEHNSPTYVRLGIVMNIVVLFALSFLLVRYFQPQMLNRMGTQLTRAGNPIGQGAARGRGAGMGGGAGAGNNAGMGPNNDLMRFHQAEIPAQYAGLTSPVAADESSLTRGAAAYNVYCVACHGESGLGDGIAAATLDPAPAPLARTSQMMGDDYLFWRISEGGTHFTTAMPAWEGAIDEQTRWDLINYMRTLDTGQTAGAGQGGGMDPAAEAARQAEMINAALAQGVITQAEADTFSAIHAQLDAAMRADATLGGSGTMFNRQQGALATLVEQATITQADADLFTAVRDQLLSTQAMQ